MKGEQAVKCTEKKVRSVEDKRAGRAGEREKGRERYGWMWRSERAVVSVITETIHPTHLIYEAIEAWL